MTTLSRHPMAGKKVTLVSRNKELHHKSGVLEDWWSNVSGKSWKNSRSNPEVAKYAYRITTENLPVDDAVVHVKIDGIGHLVHDEEILR